MPRLRQDDEVGGCCPFFRRRRGRGPSTPPPPSSGPTNGSREVKLQPNSKPAFAEKVPPPDQAVGETVSEKPLKSPGSGPASLLVGSIDSHGGLGWRQSNLSAAYGPSLRRLRAERNFRGAAAKLKRILPLDPNAFSVPEGIGLQYVERVDDVEEEAKRIEVAIEGLIHERTQWRPSERTIKIWIRDWFRASFPFVKVAFKTVGEIVPSPYALVINAFLFFLQAAYNAGQTAVEINGTLLFLSDAIHRVQVTKGFSDILNEGQLDDVNCAALNLSAVVTEYLTMAIEYFMENSLVGPIFATDGFVDAKRKIEKMTEVYSASMNALAVTMGGELLRHDKTEKRQKILEWVWSADPWLKHGDLKRRRIPNTGTWILENQDFKKWLTGEGPRFLICHGIPGSGKSFIASLVLDHTNSRASKSFKAVVIHFYFDYNDEKSQTVEDVVRSFIKQLVYQLEFMPPNLEAAYDRWIAKGIHPTRDLFIDLFITCANEFSDVYIFLDAYDECAKSERKPLIQFLQQVAQMGNVCTFITTRTHTLDDLTSLLENNKILKIKATPEDVETYISEKLESEKLKMEIKTKIVHSIRHAAAGMFLLADSQLNYVLNEVEPREIDSALASLPPTLSKAYEEIMKRIEKRPGAKRVAVRALSWILNSGRPIQMDELRELLLIRNGATELNHSDLYEAGYILDACQSLLIYGKSSGVVRFAHYAVRDFFRNDYKDLPSTTDLAIDCATYLNFEAFESVPTLDLDLRLKTYKALDYIAHFWDTHVRAAETSFEVQRLMFAFLNSDNKRRSMLQIRENDLKPSKSSVHVLAECGLAMILREALNRIQNPKEETDRSRRGSISKMQSAVEVLIDERDSDGRTALHLAAKMNRSEVITALVEAKTDVGLVDAHGRTALHLAARYGNITAIKALIAAKSEMTITDNYGMTALHLAATQGHTEAVKALLEANAGVHETDDYGRTALHLAATDEAVETASEEEDILSSDEDDDSVMMFEQESAETSVEAVTDKENEATELPNEEESDSTTDSSHHGSEHGSQDNIAETVKALIEANADVAAQDFDGMTPLHWAARDGLPDVVKALLDANADIKAKDLAGMTALHWAVGSGNVTAVDVLLKSKADVNAKNTLGQTPLHLAANHQNFNRDCVTSLLEAEADINAVDNDGLTAAQLAMKVGNDQFPGIAT